MKTRLITALLVSTILCATTTPCRADEMEMAADALVVRPACLVATVVGSALFVVSLPFAAISKSVKKSAHTFVVRPAKATFTRPLGDMEALKSES